MESNQEEEWGKEHNSNKPTSKRGCCISRDRRMDAKGTCCGSRCIPRSVCGSSFRCWGCSRGKDAFLLFSFMGLILSLIAGLAVPPILDGLLTSGINDQVVMIPGNPNLAQWESNVPAGGSTSVRSISSSIKSSKKSKSKINTASTDDYMPNDGSSIGPNGVDGSVHYDLRFFNVTNPKEMMAGAKPSLNQMGPYGYMEYYQKFDVTWSADQEEVRYGTQKYYVWSQQNSGEGLSTEDEITLIYPVVIGFQYLMGQLGANVTAMIEAAILEEMNVYYQQLIDGLDKAIAEIDGKKLLPPDKKAKLEKQISDVQAEIEVFYAQLYDFIGSSDPTDLLLKIVLGKSPNGLSPFFKSKPGPAYFGWFNDPVLMEIQKILDLVKAKTNVTVPWTSSVPGSVTNYTSIEDARRRTAPTTVKTGKSNAKDVGKLLIFQGMTSIYGCVSPMSSQNTSLYTEGSEFPACELFDLSWNESTIEAKGYHAAWANPETNLIYGRYYDGELFGRPIDPNSTPIFVGDIYRGAVLTSTAEVDWYGVTLNQLQIQQIDMQNSTTYPTNANYFSNGPMGLINLTSATGAPSFGSYPHFLEADPRLLEQVDGLNPNYDTMSTYLNVEPFTGLLAEARKQMQTNFFLTAQTFPNTPADEDWKEEAHFLCGNVSAILTELHQEPLPCGENPEVDELLDILAEKGGWSLYNGGLDGGTFFPYAYSDEYMNLDESDANSIKSSVYAIQDAEAASFQWGMISAGVFAGLTTYLVLTRMLAGESFAEILCGRSNGYANHMDQSLLKAPLLNDNGSGSYNPIHRESIKSGHSDSQI